MNKSSPFFHFWFRPVSVEIYESNGIFYTLGIHASDVSGFNLGVRTAYFRSEDDALDFVLKYHPLKF